jgi:uncharacterized protein YigA (DUF484 family)
MTIQTKPDIAARDEVVASKHNFDREDVARYLRTHSDFFVHHPELIETLSIPHETGEAISLVERQVELLRKKNKELDRKLHQLIRVAKDNERVSRRLHALALAIVSIKGFDEAVSSIQKLLHSDFPGTKVNIHLLSGLPSANVKECESIEISLLKSKLVQDLFSSRRGVTFLTKRQIENIFKQEEGKKPIRSAAAVALKKKERLGVLFLGSTDASRFQSGTGTLFLGNLGEIIGAKLHQFATT